MGEQTFWAASFAQSGGKPVSLIFAPDDAGGLLRLFVLREMPFDFEGRSRCCLITDTDTGEFDCLFDAQTNFWEALDAYRELKAQNRIDIPTDLMQYAPDNVMQHKGRSDTGRERFEFDTVENGHMALLAGAWFFRQYLAVSRAMETAEQICGLMHPVTI